MQRTIFLPATTWESSGLSLYLDPPPPVIVDLLLDPVRSPLVGDLAFGYLLERDRQRLRSALAPERDLRRGVLGHALSELGEIGGDLPAALGGEQDERVLGVDVFQKRLDARFDQVSSLR